MAYVIQFKRGLKQDLPQLNVGEVGYAIDSNEMYIGTVNGNQLLNFDTADQISDIDAGMFGDTTTGLPVDGGEF